MLPRKVALWAMILCASIAQSVLAETLWTNAGPVLAHETGPGSDILGGAVHRDDTAADVLYFRFHVNPLSDITAEEYFAAFQLYEGDTERLGVGNSSKAWAYSAFNTADTRNLKETPGDVDLHSSRQEYSTPDLELPYELPRRGIPTTIVFKVQYVPGGDDKITVWLNPDLAPGATPTNQLEAATTTFIANASFDQIRLRHGGGGPGWTFSDMAIATSFDDFWVAAHANESAWTLAKLKAAMMRHTRYARWVLALAALVLVVVAVVGARFLERRRHRRQLLQLEQESALQQERARIAQDLHDDLGSSLARLSLLSELLKADKEIPAQVEAHATKITQSAGQTVRALDEIVWALRPGSDTLQSLVEYISHFANELFEGDSGARCRLDFPADLPSRPLPPEMRHNIFLVIKEALTNALKHAHAREVRVTARILPAAVEFTVRDDGTGLRVSEEGPNSQRHGLENMRRRAEAMKATLDIENDPAHGATVKLMVPFPRK